MKIEEIKTFEDLKAYMANYRNFADDSSAFDCDGAFQLWLALLNGLEERGSDEDLERCAVTMTPHQIDYLRRILVIAAQSEFLAQE